MRFLHYIAPRSSVGTSSRLPNRPRPRKNWTARSYAADFYNKNDAPDRVLGRATIERAAPPIVPSRTRTTTRPRTI